MEVGPREVNRSKCCNGEIPLLNVAIGHGIPLFQHPLLNIEMLESVLRLGEFLAAVVEVLGQADGRGLGG